MTIPQKRRGMGFLTSYIGGWRVRARDSSNPVPYVRVGPAPFRQFPTGASHSIGSTYVSLRGS
jgi:hypothetical protein